MTYHNASGRRLAMRVHTGPGDPGTKHFFLADQLESTSTVLSATGTVEESARHYPYGSLRSGGITLTDRPARRGGKFTGQQDEGTAFGLYDCGTVPGKARGELPPVRITACGLARQPGRRRDRKLAQGQVPHGAGRNRAQERRAVGLAPYPPVHDDNDAAVGLATD